MKNIEKELKENRVFYQLFINYLDYELSSFIYLRDIVQRAKRENATPTPPRGRLRVVANFGDDRSEAGEIRARNFEETRREKKAESTYDIISSLS